MHVPVVRSLRGCCILALSCCWEWFHAATGTSSPFRHHKQCMLGTHNAPASLLYGPLVPFQSWILTHSFLTHRTTDCVFFKWAYQMVMPRYDMYDKWCVILLKVKVLLFRVNFKKCICRMIFAQNCTVDALVVGCHEVICVTHLPTLLSKEVQATSSFGQNVQNANMICLSLGLSLFPCTSLSLGAAAGVVAL